MPAPMSNNSLMISFLFLLLFPGCDWCSALSTTDSFIVKPDEEVYSEEGSDVTLEWHFHVGSWSSSSTFREFLFGVWDDPGYVRNKILVVQGNNVVHKLSGFERKVDWSGNIYDCVNCTARVKMYNLTFADFKKYGVEVEVSLDRSHLTNWLRLVKFEPAEIINSSWPRRIEVEEGNATTIECKATGRPTPSVIIKKRNRTLCHNSTGHCVYEIREAKPEDEGEYLCLVQQRNYIQNINSSLNLTVLEGRNISAIKTAEKTTIYSTINTKQVNYIDLHMKIFIVVMLILLLLCVLTVPAIRYIAKFCRRSRDSTDHYSDYSDQHQLSSSFL